MEPEVETENVELIDVKLEPHPNADRLSLQRLPTGDFCVCNTEQWKGVTKGAYIAPDGLVDTSRPEFAFLAPKAYADGWTRIRAANIRTVKSFGLMVPWEGKSLGVRHWNPPEPREEPLVVTTQSGKKVSGDPCPIKGPQLEKYDLESGKKMWKTTFEIGEEVEATEKVHGSNMGCLFDGERFLVRSRGGWKHEKTSLTVESLMAKAPELPREEAEAIIAKLESGPAMNHFWKAFRADPSLEAWCRRNPGHVLYGEVYGGSVQGGFPYDSPNKLKFRWFDVFRLADGKMLAHADRELIGMGDVPRVPLLFRGPFDHARVAELAEGRSTLDAGTLREGVVVESVATGRKLKWVGFGYLSWGKE